MGWTQQLGRTAWRHIGAIPAIRAQRERTQRKAVVFGAALESAYAGLADEQAAAKLREQIAGDRTGVSESLSLLAAREDYIHDRAYRLLAAASTNTAVESMPQEHAEWFAQEEALGRMPIKQAFARLAAHEPSLLDVQRQFDGEGADNERPGLPKQIAQSLTLLVGSGARSDDKLLHTGLASSIAHHYLRLLSGDARFGTADTPYFDCPRRVRVLTSTLRTPSHR